MRNYLNIVVLLSVSVFYAPICVANNSGHSSKGNIINAVESGDVRVFKKELSNKGALLQKDANGLNVMQLAAENRYDYFLKLMVEEAPDVVKPYAGDLLIRTLQNPDLRPLFDAVDETIPQMGLYGKVIYGSISIERKFMSWQDLLMQMHVTQTANPHYKDYILFKKSVRLTEAAFPNMIKQAEYAGVTLQDYQNKVFVPLLINLINLSENINELKLNDGTRLVHQFARLRNVSLLEAAKKKGANLNILDDDGYPTMYYAYYPAHAEKDDRTEQTLKRMISFGVDANAKGVNGRTASEHHKLRRKQYDMLYQQAEVTSKHLKQQLADKESNKNAQCDDSIARLINHPIRRADVSDDLRKIVTIMYLDQSDPKFAVDFFLNESVQKLAAECQASLYEAKLDKRREEALAREKARKEREAKNSGFDWGKVAEGVSQGLNAASQDYAKHKPATQTNQANRSNQQRYTTNNTSSSNNIGGSKPKCNTTYTAEPTCSQLKNGLGFYCESMNRASGHDFNYCVRECLNKYEAKASSITSCIDPRKGSDGRGGAISNN